MANDWLELRQHADTGIETIRAHFEGHAYDPHWHDSYLVGITLSGTQEFHCRRERHRSTPGDAFLLEPGEIHDGDAPVEGGFTYLTFYLDEAWLSSTLRGLYESVPSSYSLHFPARWRASHSLLARSPGPFIHCTAKRCALCSKAPWMICSGSLPGTASGASACRRICKAQRWLIAHGTICMPIWGKHRPVRSGPRNGYRPVYPDPLF